MTKNILILFSSVILVISCGLNKIIVEQENEIAISCLNKYIKIPTQDTIGCSDTLMLKFVNKSNMQFVFALNDTSIFFTDIKASDSLKWYSDPFDGLGVRFLDEKKKPVKIETESYYGSAIGEGESFYSKDNIIYIRPNKTKIIPFILNFPNYQFNKTFKQIIGDKSNVKYCHFAFEPNVNYANTHLKKNNINIKMNTKFLCKHSVLPAMSLV